jgi:hypothetical protein
MAKISETDLNKNVLPLVFAAGKSAAARQQVLQRKTENHLFKIPNSYTCGCSFSVKTL